MTYDLTIERLIDAPPDVVFDAFVDPEAQKVLYDNEEESDWAVDSELDLRVGGTWTIVFGKRGEEPFRVRRPMSSSSSSQSSRLSSPAMTEVLSREIVANRSSVLEFPTHCTTLYVRVIRQVEVVDAILLVRKVLPTPFGYASVKVA